MPRHNLKGHRMYTCPDTGANLQLEHRKFLLEKLKASLLADFEASKLKTLSDIEENLEGAGFPMAGDEHHSE